MKPLTIEIHGTGTHNRGAELMAIAIAERMRATFPNVRLVVPPKFGSVWERTNYGFWITWDFEGRFRAKLMKAAIKHGLPSYRKILGVIDPLEVDLILDASGFAFSDQWGPNATRNLLNKANEKGREATPLFLLPQALGPFTKPKVVDVATKLFKRAELICARDRKSLEAAKVICDPAKLKLFPDFTVGLKPIEPEGIDLPENFVAIVPNYRMIDKTDQSDAYLATLRRIITKVESANLVPILLLHDSKEDQKVIDKLNCPTVRVVTHVNPQVLKGILGKATFVVGSRFHALVSSLSQSIPCIGLGWSHKYPELFNDFAAPELVVSDLKSTTAIEEPIELLIDAQTRSSIAERIAAAAEQLKLKTESMWQEVESHIQKRLG